MVEPPQGRPPRMTAHGGTSGRIAQDKRVLGVAGGEQDGDVRLFLPCLPGLPSNMSNVDTNALRIAPAWISPVVCDRQSTLAPSAKRPELPRVRSGRHMNNFCDNHEQM